MKYKINPKPRDILQDEIAEPNTQFGQPAWKERIDEIVNMLNEEADEADHARCQLCTWKIARHLGRRDIVAPICGHIARTKIQEGLELDAPTATY